MIQGPERSARAVSPEAMGDEALDGSGSFEGSIRPQSLDEFIGQDSVVDNLRVFVSAARTRGDALDHVLLSGMPGLGKTTLAQLLATELGTSFRATSGPALEKAKDLIGILTDLSPGDVLFIDEVHRLQRVVEEYLYSAMEDFELDIVLDQGPNARSVKIPLAKFTLVAATTREGSLSAPFRARFGIQEKLDPYPHDAMCQILDRSARILDVSLSAEGGAVLARRCRGTPRIANRYLRRVRDFADVEGTREIDEAVASRALERLGVDHDGLDQTDRRILEIVARSNVPVGVKTISVSVGEEERTIEEVYEPYLIRRGFLAKTPRGRLLGPNGEARFGTAPAPAANELDFGSSEEVEE